MFEEVGNCIGIGQVENDSNPVNYPPSDRQVDRGCDVVVRDRSYRPRESARRAISFLDKS